MRAVEAKDKKLAERHERIVAAARGLAEAEGWPAVTTRRLSALIHYSQPVLYSHFKSMGEIVAAVATQGFAELAASLSDAAKANERSAILHDVCAAYLAFAEAKPVVYEAMFVLPTVIKFASDDTPPALRAAFQVLVHALGDDRADVEFEAELLWSTLHGLVVLGQSGRIPQRGSDVRLDLIVERFGGERSKRLLTR